MARWSKRHQALRRTLADREAIQEDYAALTQARAADQALREQLHALRRWDVEIARLENQLQADRQALESVRDRLAAQLAERERSLRHADPDALAAVGAKIQELERLDAETAALRAEFEGANHERRQREADNRALRAEMEQLRDQIEALDRAGVADGGRCPLCGQALTEAHREQAQTALRERGRQLGDTYRENQAWLREQRERASSQAATLKENERALLALPELRARSRELTHRQGQGRAARQEGAALRAEWEQLAAQLADESFSAETRQQLARASAERETITQDTDAPGGAPLSPEEWAEREARHQELTAASAALPEVEAALHAAEARLRELSAAQTAAQETLSQLEAAETTLRENLAQAQEAERATQQARVAERQAFQRLLSAQQEAAALARQRERGQQLATALQAAEKQRATYTELRRAFGPDGIPALLIESAIPDLQADANALLEQLSEKPLRLELRLSRRGTVETLEIRVRDEHGTHGYELFSGGEAFRIHFALRVALARALARRAGTQLRTLFVDEGFGTQDAAGRERLLRALAAIQHEFSLILVITHLDEVRAAFPRQILVTPSAAGSQWQRI